MFRPKALYGALLSCALIMPTFAHAIEADQVLISQDGVTVTKEDFDRYVEMRIPEKHRGAALDRPGAVRELIGQVFTIRALARSAEQEVDVEDPELQWKVDFQRDRLLMDALVQHRIESEADEVRWEDLAREHYQANPEDYATEERVRASHVLIGLDDRTEEEARALAEEIAERARAGEDFADLAREYSDDPSAERNAGDLGRFGRGRMVPEFEEAAFAMTEEGEISDPVESDFGYHVIRLQSRTEAETRPFEQVKRQIIRELEKEHAQEVRAAVVETVRGDDQLDVNHEAVSELEESLRIDRSRSGSDSD